MWKWGDGVVRLKRWLKKWLGIAALEEQIAEMQLTMKERAVPERENGMLLTVPADVIGEWLNGRGQE